MIKNFKSKFFSDTKPGFKTGFLFRNFFQIFLPAFFLMIFLFFIIFYMIIPLLEKKYLQNKHDMCQTLVKLAISDLNSRETEVKSGIISLQLAQARAINRFRSFRHGHDGKDYFWIQGSDAILIMHPYRPDLEGKVPDDLLAPDGSNLSELAREISKFAKKPKGGFLEYKWNWKENLDVVKNKISYVEFFEPWGWLVSTGVYLDDIESEIDEWTRTFIYIGIFLFLAVFLFAFFLSVRAARSRRREVDALDLLKENEVKFRTVFNNSPYSIAINSLQSGEYISVNMEFESFTGFFESELTDKTWHDLKFSPQHIGEDVFNALLSDGRVYNVESVIAIKSGESRNILYTAALLEMEGEEAVISIMVDATEIKKLQDALRQSQKMDVIGQLTGGIAHDFNNMLAGIMGSAELLMFKTKNNPDLAKHIELILKSSDRASELIKKLLAFARRGIEVEVVLDFHELIKESIVLLERSIDRKINIQSMLNAEYQMVKGDPVLIQNIILNLGLNARDAMSDGGTLTIATSNVDVDENFILNHNYVITPGKYIQLNVKDTGIGMNIELRSRIFEPFFTTKPEGKGTGLGMAVVYGTVKEHNGFIEVYSEPGSGTNVKIFIPVVENDKIGIISMYNEPVLGKGGVLVVDDEDIVRTIACSLLESLGYECFLAENGSRAIDIYMKEKDKIDIVLLDIIMPGISGLETSERLKEIDENVKIIFSSGFRRDEIVMGFMKNSNKRFIQKPYHLVELSRIIAETMNS